MKRLLTFLLFTLGHICFAQEKASEPVPNRTPADGPFVPAPALPGGIVLPLYPKDSPMLKQERIHEAERYNTSGKSADKLLNTLKWFRDLGFLEPPGTETQAAREVAAYAKKRAKQARRLCSVREKRKGR